MAEELVDKALKKSFLVLVALWLAVLGVEFYPLVSYYLETK